MTQTEYKFPVYGTQGGGLAKFVGRTLVWVEVPAAFPHFCVGTPIPDEWDYQPANEAARNADIQRSFEPVNNGNLIGDPFD
jgi:hypothetical protein